MGIGRSYYIQISLSRFILETPLETMQSALVVDFGQRVNLAENHPNLVPSVELQRSGMISKGTCGISYPLKSPEGGLQIHPLHYKYILPYRAVSFLKLIYREVQSAIEGLKEQGLIMDKKKAVFASSIRVAIRNNI